MGIRTQPAAEALPQLLRCYISSHSVSDKDLRIQGLVYANSSVRPTSGPHGLFADRTFMELQLQLLMGVHHTDCFMHAI